MKTPSVNFQFIDYIAHLSDELKTFGYDIEITDRSKTGSAVQQAFLKDDSIGKLIALKYVGKANLIPKIYIKLEVDTNPPSESGYENKYLDFPFVSSVTVQDTSSPFAGKIHALLCRNYLKGRDWYDFIWDTSHHIGVNFDLLSSAIQQYGRWKNTLVKIDER